MANIDMNFDAADLWEEMSAFCEDMLVDRLNEYIDEDDLECQVANMIEEKEIITADMICDVTQFEARVSECEEAINKLCDRSIGKKAKINDISAQILSNDKTAWAAIKDLQFNHSRWAEENHKVREENNSIREDYHYLFERIVDLESRTLRGRWDAMIYWIQRKFRG